jgi:hypothetical protein
MGWSYITYMVSMAVCGLVTCFCYQDFLELGDVNYIWVAIQFYIDSVIPFCIKIDKNYLSNV